MPIFWPHPVELFASPQDSPLKIYIGHYNDDGDTDNDDYNDDDADNDDGDDDNDEDDDDDGNSTGLICDRDNEKNMNNES